MTPEQADKLEAAIHEAFAEDGLVSDWLLIAEIAQSDGSTGLHHWTSDNATGWKAHGMALYGAAAHAPQPSYVGHEEGDD